MKLQKIEECPDTFFATNGWTNGHWTQCFVEFFAPTEDAEPTHMHIYNRDKAVKAYKEGAKIPPTVKTVSYQKKEKDYMVAWWRPKEELRIVSANQPLDWVKEWQLATEFLGLKSLPDFDTPEEGYKWIHENYPQHAP